METQPPTDVLMVGTGEYTTGFVGGGASKSDKGAGVVALTMIDLRKQGKVGQISMAGVNGTKFPQIREHMSKAIGEAYPASEYDLTVKTYPEDDKVDPDAYKTAISSMPRGSAVTIFTPDDTHFNIALACIEAGLHVLVTKPVVKTLSDHHRLAEAAARNNVFVMVEVHKRFDPIYTDARDRIQNLGDMSFMTAYMSQPKMQLQTFKAWAGKSSDISYYLNSHHVDFCEWCIGSHSRPEQVTATVATGVADRVLDVHTEDTITLSVQWRSVTSGCKGIGIFTSSWVAPPSDVHSQQRFFYLGQKGEVRVDQAHRGFTAATDDKGFASCNPLFMKYTPSRGRFVGQSGYGYQSFEAFIDAVRQIESGAAKPADFDTDLASIHTTKMTTAILEAGRRSADAGGRPVAIQYESDTSLEPVDMKLVAYEAGSA